MPAATTLSLVIFTRLPQPGRVKTRLIPALGAAGAAELHGQMTRLAVARAWAFCAAVPGRRLVIAYDGGSERQLRTWLGRLNCLPQGEGDLGARLQRAVTGEFQRGASSVLVIGSDCPRLQPGVLESAACALETHDLTFGPAKDGGYYLVGLRKPLSEIFTGIPWGTGDVLTASVRKAQTLGIAPALLESLPDVDLPDDLPDAQAALQASRTISVIIPALNEAPNLKRLLPRLSAAQPHEVIVADGGSADDTVATAIALGAKVVRASRGRARQMNAGAAAATGEHLLFLHADTDPPERFPDLVSTTLDRAMVSAGAFRFLLREPVLGSALIEWGVALRCALLQLPYGDQGLFVRRALFQSLGGFRDWPILEDLAMVRHLRALGRIVITSEPALTSSRRWRDGGVIRTFLRHQRILLAYFLGSKPEPLASAQTGCLPQSSSPRAGAEASYKP